MSGILHRQLTLHSLGHAFEDGLVTAFFGDRRSSLESVAMAFPDYRLVGVRQTHSDVVCLSPHAGETPEADAHLTSERRIALIVKTADCVPVLIHDPESRTVAAIHAGWRGVENEIIRKTGARLKSLGTSLGGARAWIGPHIGSASFEVDEDVALKLEARLDAVRAHTSVATSLLDHPHVGKRRVDLLAIVRAQLGSIGIERERTMELAIDTMMSPEHESFRRDRDRAGRQISFIALK